MYAVEVVMVYWGAQSWHTVGVAMARAMILPGVGMGIIIYTTYRNNVGANGNPWALPCSLPRGTTKVSNRRRRAEGTIRIDIFLGVDRVSVDKSCHCGTFRVYRRTKN